MATKAKRLEVFDFKEDEEPEIQPRKHFPKLGNPNPDHDVKWKYQFLELIAPGSDAVTLAESDLVCAVSDPPSCREPVDMKSYSDESVNENFPSKPAPDAPESGATLSGDASINGFSDSEIVDMDIVVDYVLYRGIFHPLCVVTFSCNGIKINGSITRGNLKTLSLEKQIDDIDRIESQHVQSTKSVIVKLIISSKDASQSADACGTSGIEELEFAFVEPNWSEKRDKITSLNVKYLALWSVIHEIIGLLMFVINKEAAKRARMIAWHVCGGRALFLMLMAICAGLNEIEAFTTTILGLPILLFGIFVHHSVTLARFV